MSEELAARAANLETEAPAAPATEAPAAPSEEATSAPVPPVEESESKVTESAEGMEDLEDLSVRTLQINMEGVTTEFEPLPVGTFLARVYEVEYQAESKKSGKPQLRWTFEVTAPDYEGRRIWSYTSLTKDSLWKLSKLLNALGVEVPDGELNLDLDEMVGLPCLVSVTQDVYEGKKTNPVSEVLPVGDSTTSPPY